MYQVKVPTFRNSQILRYEFWILFTSLYYQSSNVKTCELNPCQRSILYYLDDCLNLLFKNSNKVLPDLIGLTHYLLCSQVCSKLQDFRSRCQIVVILVKRKSFPLKSTPHTVCSMHISIPGPLPPM